MKQLEYWAALDQILRAIDNMSNFTVSFWSSQVVIWEVARCVCCWTISQRLNTGQRRLIMESLTCKIRPRVERSRSGLLWSNAES